MKNSIRSKCTSKLESSTAFQSKWNYLRNQLHIQKSSVTNLYDVLMLDKCFQMIPNLLAHQFLNWNSQRHNSSHTNHIEHVNPKYLNSFDTWNIGGVNQHEFSQIWTSFPSIESLSLVLLSYIEQYKLNSLIDFNG